jgi:D-alanine-D-alanine ligase
MFSLWNPLMNIEIITTPNSALKESGFGSLTACNSVIDAVQGMGHGVRLNTCQTKKDLDEVVKRKPDLIITAVKYIPVSYKDDIWLSEYFAEHGINFTGSSRDVLKYDSNKVLAKTHLANKSIRTANYFIAIPGQFKTENDLPLPFPLFLKPLDAANGNGIDDQSFVTSFTEYDSKISSLYTSFNQPVLAEEYLEGPEFTVAVIKTPGEKLTVSAVEAIAPLSGNGLRILGAQAKKDDSEELVKIEDNEVSRRVTALAIDAFNALGARDFGRIDIKTSKSGEYFFMEANLVPGMTYGSSYFPEACRIANGLAYDKVVELLLAGGIARASSTIPPTILPDADDKIASIL